MLLNALSTYELGGLSFPNFTIRKSWESILNQIEDKSLTDWSANKCLISQGLCLCVFGTHFVTTMWSPGWISSCHMLWPPTEVMDRISVSWSTALLEADEKRSARTLWLIFFPFYFLKVSVISLMMFSVSLRTLNHLALKYCKSYWSFSNVHVKEHSFQKCLIKFGNHLVAILFVKTTHTKKGMCSYDLTVLTVILKFSIELFC